MTALDDLVDPASVAGLLALASAAAGGSAIGLVDTGGGLVAGRSAGPVPARVHAVAVDGRAIGAVTGDDGVTPEMLALVARSLELVLEGGRADADRTRMTQELAIGRRIQMALLPRRFPDVPGWSFGAHYEPAREVGGDLFDVFPLRGRTDAFALLVADVTGKGIPAALLMADVRALLHAATDNADGPGDALARVNRILVTERATSLFVTAALLVVDAASGLVRHASAGHDPVLVARSAGGVEALEGGGPILGAFPDAAFAEATTSIGPDDAIVLYTDGITEARDERRRFYGEERLFDILDSAGGHPADGIVAAVVRDVEAFRGAAEPFDDVTLLVAQRRRAG
jgi:sigma-B regulation protein RsbU (phosphoserine phosphatase)